VFARVFGIDAYPGLKPIEDALWRRADALLPEVAGNPGAIEARREGAGKLYNVQEFAAEVALAAVEPVPADNTRLVGDTSDFK
jgi:hypothetical protein